MTPPEVRARDITAALRTLYPGATLRCRANPDGTADVRIPALCARYLGVGRDSHQVAAWISAYAPYGVRVTGYDWVTDSGGRFAVVTLARLEYSRPADPRTSAGVPSYATAEQVTGEWPANRQVTGLITLAVEAGCRPHVSPQRSPHGRRYRAGLWHVNPELLHGVIDVLEDSGRFASAWYSWGCGPERKTGDPGEIRQQLASARDLHRAGTLAASGKRRGGSDQTGHRPPVRVQSVGRARRPQIPQGRPALPDLPGSAIMTLAEIKRRVQPAQVYDITNHYITRPDHPSYGTTRRSVVRTTQARIYMSMVAADSRQAGEAREIQRLRELAGDLWRWLNDDPGDPAAPTSPGAPASWFSEPADFTTADLEYEDGFRNYARRDTP